MAKLKKGDVSINVLIIAAMALIVLVILIAIFSGRIGKFGKEYDSTKEGATANVCGSNGGYCEHVDENCRQGYNPSAGSWLDCTENQMCCISTQ